MKRRQLLFVLLIIMFLTACGRPSEEQVRSQMEKYLYEKYGEEFVVDRIGMRSANEQKFYQARIYPKSIIGTEKEEDDYYYASASINVESFGRLSKGVGDSYSFINRNDDVEKYLLPKAKELFGDRIRLKVDVKHEVTGDGSWWAGYKSSSLQEMRDDIKKEPDRTRIVLTLYLYIFDRIDNEEEKEERREQIFEFIQYLKVEGLFEYTRVQFRIVDERVLTNSYREFRQREKYSREEEFTRNDKYRQGGKIKLPPLEFRKEMTEVLSKELKEMTEKELINNMNKIKKNEIGGLPSEGIVGNSIQNFVSIDSIGRLKLVNQNKYEELKNANQLFKHEYSTVEYIVIGEPFTKFLYTYVD